MTINGAPQEINGWIIEENKYDGFPATKKFIAFHPIYDGHHWEQHDTMDEVTAFCTVERFNQWSKELL
jgi:hypothetical protein